MGSRLLAGRFVAVCVVNFALGTSAIDGSYKIFGLATSRLVIKRNYLFQLAFCVYVIVSICPGCDHG